MEEILVQRLPLVDFLDVESMGSVICVSKKINLELTKQLTPKVWADLITCPKRMITKGFKAEEIARPSLRMLSCFMSRRCALCFRSYLGKTHSFWRIFAHSDCIKSVIKGFQKNPAHKILVEEREESDIEPVPHNYIWLKKIWCVPDVWTFEGFREVPLDDRDEAVKKVSELLREQTAAVAEARRKIEESNKVHTLQKKRRREDLAQRREEAKKQRIGEIKALFLCEDSGLWQDVHDMHVTGVLGDLLELKLKCQTKIDDSLVKLAKERVKEQREWLAHGPEVLWRSLDGTSSSEESVEGSDEDEETTIGMESVESMGSISDRGNFWWWYLYESSIGSESVENSCSESGESSAGGSVVWWVGPEETSSSGESSGAESASKGISH